jgi:hypothetical protein
MARTSNRRLRPIIVGVAAAALGLAACGGGAPVGVVSVAPESAHTVHRAAQAAAAQRYVDMLEDRAAAVSAGTVHRAAQAAAAQRYVDMLEDRAAAM